MRWIAGYNMPGYLPETDPESFFTWDAAVEYLKETVQRWYDSDVMLPEEVEDGSREYESTLATFDAIKTDDPGHPFNVYHGVANDLVLWVVASEAIEVPETEFDGIYDPIVFDDHYLLDGELRDTVGDIPEEHIWSLVDGDDGNVWLVNGRRDDNIGFEVTGHPWTGDTFTLISANEEA